MSTILFGFHKSGGQVTYALALDSEFDITASTDSAFIFRQLVAYKLPRVCLLKTTPTLLVD